MNDDSDTQRTSTSPTGAEKVNGKDLTAQASPAPESQDLREIHDVISRYVSQMLYGCGNPHCKQLLCANGRQNAQGRPLRKHTPRSARIIALTLVSGPKPRSRLCALRSDPDKHAHSAFAEEPHDHSSVIQLIADTESIRLLCDPARSPTARTRRDYPQFRYRVVVDTLRLYHTKLDEVEHLCTTTARFERALEADLTIARIVCECLRHLVGTLPQQQGSKEQILREWEVINTLIGNASAYPSSLNNMTSLGRRDVRIDLLDGLDDLPRSRLLCHCLRLICQRVLTDHNDHSPPNLHLVPSADETICRAIMQRMQAEWSLTESCILLIWLKKTFLSLWEGETLLQRGSLSLICLKLLDCIWTCTLEQSTLNTSGGLDKFRELPAITAHVDAVDMARSWIELSARHGNELQRPFHLLEFSWLFDPAQRAVYFRMLNHLRMQQAHSDADKSARLRMREARNNARDTTDPESVPQLKFLEDHYLLLNIGRASIVSDSFDQIWQRRASELLRPLRVRLGEMDTFEVGHDLGGVQIEFFNLLCKEIFSESIGMFDTDEMTGLSYFRPGCLQPLYMFELFGLLFGIAMYNGITLPVSLPLAFYTLLLGHPCAGLKSIRDGWPAMHKSLLDIMSQDIPGMECVFAMEANGIRLSISSSAQEPEREIPKITARVVEATAIGHHPKNSDRIALSEGPSKRSATIQIDLHAFEWPGWSFEPAPANEPADLTPENKREYIKDYVNWLTYASVARQWHHFRLGFHRIMPLEYIRMFPPPQLQSTVEGTRHISIPDLRRVTAYDGYDHDSSYIKAFWIVVANWPESRQRQLLKFVTAAERVPVGGAGNVTFRIQRVSHPGAQESLPTSSTCFGTLLLPRYANSKVLEKKLIVALDMGGEGFGTG